MAAKKRRSSKKKVTITIDADALRKLREAVEALSEFAGAFELKVDDPVLRREIRKRRTKKRR
jgi:hypothetical protein